VSTLPDDYRPSVTEH